MKAIILNGISGNLKSTIASKLNIKDEIVVVPSLTESIYQNAEKFYGSSYPIPTELHLLFKLSLWDNLKLEEGKVYLFEKSLVELIMYNQWMMSNQLMYKVSTNHQFTFAQCKSILSKELDFFNQFDEVQRVLLTTHDMDFIEANLVGEDESVGKRADTFWDANHYTSLQDSFISEFKSTFSDFNHVRLTDMKTAISEAAKLAETIYSNGDFGSLSY